MDLWSEKSEISIKSCKKIFLLANHEKTGKFIVIKITRYYLLSPAYFTCQLNFAKSYMFNVICMNWYEQILLQ